MRVEEKESTAMNYYKARQREKDGRWDYTCMRDGNAWPIGYCSSWSKIEQGLHLLNLPDGQDHLEKLLPFKDNYHDDGHATQEEAEECYKNYLLDQRLKRVELKPSSGYTEPPKHPCVECGAPTSLQFEVEMRRKPICEEHFDKKIISKHFKAPVGSWSSY